MVRLALRNGGQQMVKPTLVILAAGIGRRFGGLKQLEPVGPDGATIMDYSVFDALRAGFGKVVFVCRPETLSVLQSSIGQRVAGRVVVEYVVQRLDDLPAGLTPPPGRTKPWGTGQAVLAAASAVHEPFGVVNADDFYGARAFAALGEFLCKPTGAEVPTYALMGYRLALTLAREGPVNRAVCTCDGDWLRSIAEVVGITPLDEARTLACYCDEGGEPHTIPGDQVVSMNMWGFTPEVFAQLRAAFVAFLQESAAIDRAEFFLPDVIQAELDAGRVRVKVLPSNSTWCGMTHPADKARVAEIVAGLIKQGEYPAELWRAH
jgi:hypothetical protein